MTLTLFKLWIQKNKCSPVFTKDVFGESIDDACRKLLNQYPDHEIINPTIYDEVK